MNRQSETRNSATMPYVYSPPNWLYQKGSETRPKTLNGNTASTGTASFTYDGYNRLVTSQTAAETTTYTYNALGERIKKINQNGLSTVFHYGPNGELLWEKDQAGNTKAYVWLDGRPLARIDNNAQIYYYHVDYLGTPWAMTNSAGAVVWKGYYEPFGKAIVRINTVENNLRSLGQYFDRETGMHYNYFRDYDPATGRYPQADPIGLAGGLNVYSYVSNNPLRWIDPTGLAQVSTGGEASGHAGLVGLGVGGGVTIDDNGTICVYASGSLSFGLGIYAGAGFNVGGSTGSNTTGLSGSGGVFLEGGGGIAAGTEINVGADRSVGGGKGFGGVGVGGAGGFRQTGTATYCFNQPKTDKGCKK